MIFCGECKFWKNDANTPEGQCRIKPPVIVGNLLPLNDNDVYFATQFPRTSSEEWCGEGRISDVPRPERK